MTKTQSNLHKYFNRKKNRFKKQTNKTAALDLSCAQDQYDFQVTSLLLSLLLSYDFCLYFILERFSGHIKKYIYKLSMDTERNGRKRDSHNCLN